MRPHRRAQRLCRPSLSRSPLTTNCACGLYDAPAFNCAGGEAESGFIISSLVFSSITLRCVDYRASEPITPEALVRACAEGQRWEQPPGGQNGAYCHCGLCLSAAHRIPACSPTIFIRSPYLITSCSALVG